MKTVSNPHSRNVADVATEYFAYVAGISLAVALAVIAIVYSGRQALTWIDAASRPAAPAAITSAADLADRSDEIFAMLPSGLTKSITPTPSGRL